MEMAKPLSLWNLAQRRITATKVHAVGGALFFVAFQEGLLIILLFTTFKAQPLLISIKAVLST